MESTLLIPRIVISRTNLLVVPEQQEPGTFQQKPAGYRARPNDSNIVESSGNHEPDSKKDMHYTTTHFIHPNDCNELVLAAEATSNSTSRIVKHL